MRSTVAGTLLALLVSGVAAAPAAADDRGILEHDVDVDMSLPRDVFYPAVDSYRDRLLVRVFESPSTNEVMRSITIRVKDGTGSIVHTVSVDPADLAAAGTVTEIAWDGTIDGALAPEGGYKVQATIVDSSNDEKVVSKDFRLDHAQIRTTIWRRTFRAADVLIDRHVGACAHLKRPARPGWRGSLGYRSGCRSGNRSVVSTVQGVYLPRPFRSWHHWVRVSVTGGDAAGGPRSSLAYFVYLTSERWSRHVYRFGPSLGRHRGLSYRGTAVVLGRHTQDRPTFLWTVGLCCGAGYDVKSFTVTTSYEALR